jgi:hypothetical protein
MSYNPFTRQGYQAATGRFNQNQSGSALPQGSPVKITSSGISLVDVSQEGDVDAFAGVLANNSANGTTGQVISSGSIPNITTSFAIGSIIYISKTGILTNVKPSVGVNGFGEGDFIIKIGMIAQNIDNPTNKDLLVQIQHMGQL